MFFSAVRFIAIQNIGQRQQMRRVRTAHATSIASDQSDGSLATRPAAISSTSATMMKIYAVHRVRTHRHSCSSLPRARTFLSAMAFAHASADASLKWKYLLFSPSSSRNIALSWQWMTSPPMKISRACRKEAKRGQIYTKRLATGQATAPEQGSEHHYPAVEGSVYPDPVCEEGRRTLRLRRQVAQHAQCITIRTVVDGT